MLSEINYYRGDSWPITLLVKDKNTQLPIDLTGCAFTLTVDTEKNPADETTKVFETAGIIDQDPTTGLVAFLPTTLNTDLTPGTYYYDVEYVDSFSNVRTILKDKFKILQDVTK